MRAGLLATAWLAGTYIGLRVDASILALLLLISATVLAALLLRLQRLPTWPLVLTALLLLALVRVEAAGGPSSAAGRGRFGAGGAAGQDRQRPGGHRPEHQVHFLRRRHRPGRRHGTRRGQGPGVCRAVAGPGRRPDASVLPLRRPTITGRGAATAPAVGRVRLSVLPGQPRDFRRSLRPLRNGVGPGGGISRRLEKVDIRPAPDAVGEPRRGIDRSPLCCGQGAAAGAAGTVA